jgi:hypothetical protein
MLYVHSAIIHPYHYPNAQDSGVCGAVTSEVYSFTIAEIGERQGKLANRPYLKELAN